MRHSTIDSRTAQTRRSTRVNRVSGHQTPVMTSTLNSDSGLLHMPKRCRSSEITLSAEPPVTLDGGVKNQTNGNIKSTDTKASLDGQGKTTGNGASAVAVCKDFIMTSAVNTLVSISQDQEETDLGSCKKLLTENCNSGSAPNR